MNRSKGLGFNRYMLATYLYLNISFYSMRRRQSLSPARLRILYILVIAPVDNFTQHCTTHTNIHCFPEPGAVRRRDVDIGFERYPLLKPAAPQGTSVGTQPLRLELSTAVSTTGMNPAMAG